MKLFRFYSMSKNLKKFKELNVSFYFPRSTTITNKNKRNILKVSHTTNHTNSKSIKTITNERELLL